MMKRMMRRGGEKEKTKYGSDDREDFDDHNEGKKGTEKMVMKEVEMMMMTWITQMM